MEELKQETSVAQDEKPTYMKISPTFCLFVANQYYELKRDNSQETFYVNGLIFCNSSHSFLPQSLTKLDLDCSGDYLNVIKSYQIQKRSLNNEIRKRFSNCTKNNHVQRHHL